MPNEKVGIFRAAAAAVIINDQEQVLLTQRGLDRDHHPGEWEILSGRLDQGEGFEQALDREAWEELQIKVEVIALLDTFHFFRGKEKIEHIGVAFLAQHTEGTITVDGIEEVAYGWFSFADAIEKVNDESIKSNLRKSDAYLQARK